MGLAYDAVGWVLSTKKMTINSVRWKFPCFKAFLIAIIFLFVFLNSIAYADDMYPDSSNEFEKCYANIKSDASLFDCMEKRFIVVDKRREHVSHMLLIKMKKQGFLSYKRFLEEDKVWKNYRDLECNIESDSEMGTYEERLRNDCLVGLDLQRIVRMKFLIDQVKDLIEIYDPKTGLAYPY